jgi:hypothetical protein
MKKLELLLFVASFVIMVILVLPLIYSGNQQSKSVNVQNDNITKTGLYTSDNLGINLPWLDLHNGNVAYSNWLNTPYDSNLIDKDLVDVQAMGITKIRSWCTMESVFDYNNGAFTLKGYYNYNKSVWPDRCMGKLEKLILM